MEPPKRALRVGFGLVNSAAITINLFRSASGNPSNASLTCSLTFCIVLPSSYGPPRSICHYAIFWTLLRKCRWLILIPLADFTPLRLKHLWFPFGQCWQRRPLRGNKCEQFFSTEDDWHHACLEETHKLLQITLKEVKEDGCPVRVSLHGGTPPFCIVLLLCQLPTIWLHKAAAKTIESLAGITAQPLCQQNLTKTETSSTIRNHELEGAHETKHFLQCKLCIWNTQGVLPIFRRLLRTMLANSFR